MKVALVTTPPTVRSGIGDYTRHLLEHLRELCDVSVFVEHGLHGEVVVGIPSRSVRELDPRDFDRVVFQLGNEIAHAFMTPLVRALGGTVVLHDWLLFDQALAAFPALARGGWRGHLLALREGGPEAACIYAQNRREKRRSLRSAPVGTGSALLFGGWHAHESAGRWTADLACVRVVPTGAKSARIDVWSEPGRTLRIRQGARTLAELAFTPERRESELQLELDSELEPVLELETSGIRESEDQRHRGDPRRLGTFVRSLHLRDGGGWRALDLAAHAAPPPRTVALDRDRFALAFNRSIVHGADAFLVHSEFVKHRLLSERREATPIGVVSHGASARWRAEDRRIERERLELSEGFRRGFLLTSFGVVQRHKRVDVLLAALARARRERNDLHLALVGTLEPLHFDPQALVRAHGLESVVHLTGWVPEQQGWRWIHAGDLAVQLRGPSTGGTSGGVFQSLSVGRGVIATELDEQRELPDSCVLKVAPGEGEVEALARILIELRDDPDRRAALERSAREFVERECSWPRVARRYLDSLESFPGPRLRPRIARDG